MADPITTTLGIKSLIDLKEELKSLYKAGKAEIQYLLDDGLQSYAISQKEKFEKLKTFLYQHDRVDFYDTFYPLDLVGIKPNGNTYTVRMDKNLAETFKDGNCVTVIGDAGSGKSMLMKHFFLYFLNYEMEIPLFIELRNLNSFEGSFYEYIEKYIFNNHLSPNNKILNRLMEDGKFLFLLDGYDELHENTKNRRKDEINQFIDKYRKNYFIISSRPGAESESLPRFNNLKVSQIKRDEIKKFVKRQLAILENKDTLEFNIINVIDDSKNKDYLDYMSSPLLLTMFIFTFKNHPELPHTKSKFYYNVFDTLCTRHDNFSKSGDIHKRKTNLKTEDFEDILKWFSFYSYFDGKFNFDKQYLAYRLEHIKKKKRMDFSVEDLIYDLTVSIGVIIIDGLEYRYPHRSLQEYFIAVLMSQRPPEKKIADYKNKYFGKNNRAEPNLWGISEELDPYYFKATLISELGELLAILQQKNIQNSTLSFFELFWIAVLFDKETKGRLAVMINNKNGIYYSPYFLLSYLNIDLHILPLGFIYTDKLHKKLQTSELLSLSKRLTNRSRLFDNNKGKKMILQNKKEAVIHFNKEVNIHLYEYFSETGLNKSIQLLLDKINNKQKQLEKSIIGMRKIENELFDFD